MMKQILGFLLLFVPMLSQAGEGIERLNTFFTDVRSISANFSQQVLDPNDKAKNRRIEVILIPNLDELFEIISK